MSKLLLDFQDYEKHTGYTAENFYDKFIKPLEKATFQGMKTKKNKEPISSKIRWEVWERDNFTCKFCGSRKNLSVDHIIPESKGGLLIMDNLQTLCNKCNSKKGAK